MTSSLVVTDPRRLRLILAVVSLSLMMVVSAVSGLNVALPEIARDTQATQSQLQWIIDAYTVTFAGLLFIFGAFGDRYGRRLLLISGLIVFGGAATAALFTSSPESLIFIRAVMGIGAAAVMPTTLSIITTAFPEEKRGAAVGLWVGVAGGGGVLGLLMSGILLEFFSWNSFFALNVTLAIIALVGAIIIIPNSLEDHPSTIDVFGGLLSFVAIGGIVFGFIEGPSAGWLSAQSLGAIAIGVLAAIGFVLWSLRREHPLLDPRLFKLRGFGTGSASNTIQFFAAFGFFFIIVQYLQFVIGLSPLMAALATLPMVIVLIPTARNAPRLAAKIGYNKVGSTGLVLMAVGFIVFSRIGVDLNYAQFVVGLLIFGLGMGLAAAPATTAITSSLPASKQGVASAMNDAAREVGSALGIAILGSVLNAAYRNGMTEVTANLPNQAAEAAQGSVAAAQALGAQAGPGARLLVDTANASFVSGASQALLVGAVVLVVGGIFVFVRAPHSESENSQ